MNNASEAILVLKPVTFRYKEQIDPEGIPQFGLIAEEVAKVNSDLVVRDDDGEIYTVRYEGVNAMLLNEFLKEHRQVEEQRSYFESKLADQQKEFEAKSAGQQKQIDVLIATVQNVSDELKLSKPTGSVVSLNE